MKNDYGTLQKIIDCGGEIRIGRDRHLKSLIQVYIDKELIAESEAGITDIEEALVDVNVKIGKYIENNW